MLEALPSFIEAMEQDPTGQVCDGIILHQADQVAIGGIGFHGPPDEAGMVEIGYNIIPAYEGQGYACNGYLGHPYKNKQVEMEKDHLSLLANLGGAVYNQTSLTAYACLNTDNFT